MKQFIGYSAIGWGFFYSTLKPITDPRTVGDVIKDIHPIPAGEKITVNIFERRALKEIIFTGTKEAVENSLKEWQGKLKQETYSNYLRLQKHYTVNRWKTFTFVLQSIAEIERRVSGFNGALFSLSPFTTITITIYFKKERMNLFVRPMKKDYFLKDLETLKKVKNSAELDLWIRERNKQNWFDDEPPYLKNIYIKEPYLRRIQRCEYFNFDREGGW
ncbi:MAG: hypothetical protein HUU43_14545 [Ignavibacteriaceae bacterium]|nr:hypothetical protein [Ignavibacteriaceae bacterium]